MRDQISPHFKRSEFACKCGCGFDTVDVDLISVLEAVRHEFNSPVTVNSGCRCDGHNMRIGGAADSLHRIGKAADIVVNDIDPVDVAAWLNGAYPKSLGIGTYRTHTHVDVRLNRERW